MQERSPLDGIPRLDLQGTLPSHAAGLVGLSVALISLCGISAHYFSTAETIPTQLTFGGVFIASAASTFAMALSWTKQRTRIATERGNSPSSLALETDNGIVRINNIPSKLLRDADTIELMRRVLLGAEPLPDPSGILKNGEIQTLTSSEAATQGKLDNAAAIAQLAKAAGTISHDEARKVPASVPGVGFEPSTPPTVSQ